MNTKVGSTFTVRHKIESLEHLFLVRPLWLLYGQGNRIRFGTLQASASSSNDGLVGFIRVLAAHLLSIDAGHPRNVVAATCM